MSENNPQGGTLASYLDNQSSSGSVPVSGGPLKILIVENEPSIAKLFEMKLASAGFLVSVASGGEEALVKTHSEKFNLIITDLIMPQGDGFTLIQKFREEDKVTPIIISSNLGQTEDITRAMNLGANAYFIKSETPLHVLLDLVTKALQKK